jgi:hypothetical protein
MPVAYQDIARVLDGARRRQAWVAVGTAAGWGVAGAAAALLLGALGLGLGLGPWVRPAALALAALALAAALGWAAWRLARGTRGPEAAADTVARGDPLLRSALLSSVELFRDRDAVAATGRFSVELLDEHVARTAARARTVDLARAIPSRPARNAVAALAAVAAVQAVLLASLGPHLRRGYGRLLAAAAPSTAPRQDPITGEIELTYLYPAYMGRPEKKVPGSGGDVAAPRGTEVRLATRSDRPIQAARIVVESHEAPIAPLAAEEERSGTDARAKGSAASSAGEGAGAREAIGQPPGAGEAAAGPTSGADAAPGSARSPRAAPPRGAAPREGAAELAAAPPGPTRRAYALQVENGRDLTGSFLVEGTGSYRFQFVDPRDPEKVLVQGPPIPVVVEPDAFPEVRVTLPAGEVEVDAGSRVHVEWTASDDVGLSELNLVLKPPAGEEERRPLRAFEAARRDSGSFELDLAPLHLAEGERLLYWLEVKDNDAVSGPKRAASSTHAVKIYSEAEHHRAALEQARRQWEEMVRLLADRIEQLPKGGRHDLERTTRGEALDARARILHERTREVAAALRKDRSAPREIPAALGNVAQGIRTQEQRLTAARQTLSRWLKIGRGDDLSMGRRLDELDEAMNGELEKDVLYLEQLFDKRRAEDLVRIAKDLASRRRDLASLLDRYKQAPTEQGKKELLAQIARLRGRMGQMMRQMAELARGVSDEHMNAEAMAEMARSQDALSGMKRVEELVARGDVDAAMKELDALGNALQEMLSSLQRTAGVPDERNAALARQMKEFQRDLEAVQRDQERTAAETEQVKAQYKKSIAERLRRSEETARRLQELARRAAEEIRQARPGTSPRSEDDYAQARDRLEDLNRALGVREFDAALDVAKRALPPMQRLAGALRDDAVMAERYATLQKRSAEELRDSARHAADAIPPARQVREELEKLFPDPRTVLPRGEQQKLDRLAQRQQELEQRAGKLQQQLEALSREAPIFPPQAGQSLGEGRGHMQAAAEELGRRNPQRGHGQQREALDSLARLQRGLEEMARGGGAGGGGFPFPFGETGTGREGGMEAEASREKVEIPGAEAYKVPEEYRKDLLEAMKQGTPESYRGEVKRYYEELVK